MSKNLTIQWGPFHNDKTVVKATNATSLQKVLEEACSKRGVNPHHYALQQGGRSLDLGLSIMMANLPSLRIDLVQTVFPNLLTVVLEIEGGGKITEKVSPDLTLWETLEHFQGVLRSPGRFTQPTAGSPVCFVGDRAFTSGGDFKTPLRDLQGGEASPLTIRVCSREVEEGKALEPFKVQERPQKKPAVAAAAAAAAPSPPQPTATPSPSEGEHVADPQVQASAAPAAPREPVDRNFKVFSAPKEMRNYDEMEVPEAYYDLSEQDLMRLQFSKDKKGTEGELLKTRAMREQEEAKKKARFSKSTIRVKFPDQVQIQADFSVDDTMADIYQWVRGTMDSELPFELFQSPPRRVFHESSATLYSQGLFPSALVHLTWLSDSKPTGFLKSEVAEKMEDLHMPAFLIEGANAEASSSTKPAPSRPQAAGAKTATPKWLKLAK